MKRKPPTETKLICPECSAVIVTSRPEALVWELCPGCRHHIWDTYDVMMADAYSAKKTDLGIHGGTHADN